MGEASKRAKCFEDLHIFQEARKLANQVYEVTRMGPVSRDYALVDQMRRSAVSVMSNIAEGFERGTDAEFTHSLFIAKGSCGELRAQLLLAQDQKYFSAEECEDASGRCRQISAGISNLIRYLRRSEAGAKPGHRR